MKDHFFSSNKIRLLSAMLAVAFALPVFWKGFTGLYAWFSPFIMLNSVFVLKSFVLLNVLGFVVLAFSLFKKRWFCRYMCPVGYGCDFVSKYSPRRNFKLSRIPDISKVLAFTSIFAAIVGLPLFIMLDPMAIFHGFFLIFSKNNPPLVILSFSGLPVLLALHILFPRIWCARICPLGGLQEISHIARKALWKMNAENKDDDTINGTKRRLFISSGLGILAGLLVPGYLFSSSKNYIRPPASLPSGLFNTLCIRCGNCIKSCPTRIIANNSDKSNPAAWMTPVISFENSYCLEDCNICGRVCPSGAITEFSTEAKIQLVMALAVIYLEDCLLTRQTECDRCREACKYDAIEINYLNSQMAPVVDEGKCVGCGACAVICPPFTIKMIPPKT